MSSQPLSAVQWWLEVAWVEVRIELRRWSRQRVAVVSALLLPLAMAALISAALGGIAGNFSTSFAVVDEDRGPAATSFVKQVLGSPAVRDVVEVEEAATPDEARRLLDGGDVDAAIVLPSGMTERLVSSTGLGIEVLRDDSEPIAGDLAALLVDQFEIQGRATALAAASGDGGSSPEPWPLELTVTAPGGGQLDASTHFGPAIGLFFVLVTMGFVARQLIADRQRGVVERLAAAPVAPSAVLTGRAGAALAVGGLSMVTLTVAMQLLFGRSWGPAVPVILVTAAAVVAMSGVAAVLAAVARTPDQAQVLSAGVAFVFALASGSFAPPGAGVTRTGLAELVPTTHALNAFSLLTTEGGDVSTVASSIATLLAFGAAGLVLTLVLMRKMT